MPANVETMMWLNQVPWHGLGNEITEETAYNLKDSIIASGLNWEVETKQCYIKTREADYFFPSNLEAVSAYATVRKTDNKVLGIVGERYEILQNIDAFNVFQPFLDNKLCRLNTAGSLDEGKRIWILAEILGEQIKIRDDNIRKFVLLSHGHDGKSVVRFGLTPIRVVCANTLAMAHGDKLSQLFKVKHTQNMLNSLNDIRDIINEVNLDYQNTANAYRLLASKKCDHDQLDKYVKKVFKINGEEKISTRSSNIIERVKSYFIHSPGAQGESYFDAYNAVTFYMSHDYGNNSNNRLSSLWFGRNFEINKEALELALS